MMLVGDSLAFWVVVVLANILGNIFYGQVLFPWSKTWLTRGDSTTDDEAETDRFLTDLGRAYQEELARKIADQCDSLVRTIVVSVDTPLTLATVDLKSLVYKTAIEVLSKE